MSASHHSKPNTPPRPLVGISSCMTGARVRYDGADKFNTMVARHIQPHVQLLPVCPESMAGLGIPRPPVNLIWRENQVRAVGRDIQELDVTERLLSMGQRIANAYPELKGFIVQSRSPSCGFQTTPLYNANQSQVLRTDASGLFLSSLMSQLPNLIVLNDADLSPATIAQFLEAVG